ncbi:hypothetical protein H6F67_26650 [Microcoleus sp. FACHB-1515]|uniref:hypothetical protein n=1 Tax=Cyanophyceae TaxID=3028117 RepID=UPI001685CFB8|nr:hypothetical protein [Microcoleus sp. FACHB-1515]MBD2093426.1 hypothetical protein [Microcoleus sp. FACHB-1515]
MCERAYQHTILVDQISEQIKQNPDVINWIRTTQDVKAPTSITTDTNQDTDTKQGHSWLPKGLVQKLCDHLKETPQFEGMSGRSCTSATERVEEMYESWIATHQKLISQIRGKERWLSVVKSDAELAENSNFSQLEVESRAEQVLSEIEAENESEDESVDAYNRRVFNILFDKFDTTEDVLSRRAMIHLLKNGGKVRLEPRKPRKRKGVQDKPSQAMTLEERLAAN